MYQFWMNVMDADAVRFLKIFTFLSLDEIEDIRKEFEAAPHERLAQKVLAREVVTLVHGEEAYNEALNTFSYTHLDVYKRQVLFRMVPKLTLSLYLRLSSFRAVLFRMVPKRKMIDGVFVKGFRAVLFLSLIHI